MKLTTAVNIPKSDFKLQHKNSITLIGSCFSQHIGNKLAHHKFKTNPNSFGTVFNPISIANNLHRLIKQERYNETDFYNYENKKIVNFNNQFSSFDINTSTALAEQNKELIQDITHFKTANTLIITFGTAWVYQLNETQHIVANCHKIPNTKFTKKLFSVEEIIIAYQPILEQLKHINIIFTVSPVRHSKDGLYENNLSKSTLHLAINQLTQQFKNCNYFPAYEIVIDELRDYRFYNDDLVHPTDLAVNYVWERFSECYFSEETQLLNTQINKIQTALNHKPFNPESEEYQKFLANTKNQISELTKNYSFLNF
ncbi:MAG: GSCFA domain-containing protein [Vicingaceae bacterium]|nr:GSCFA domain-containing protein [Vicingaceae bacterium]